MFLKEYIHVCARAHMRVRILRKDLRSMAECCARSSTISFQRNEKLPGYVGARRAFPGLILILHPKADL